MTLGAQPFRKRSDALLLKQNRNPIVYSWPFGIDVELSGINRESRGRSVSSDLSMNVSPLSINPKCSSAHNDQQKS